MADGVSLSVKVRSIVGLICSASMSSRSTDRSLEFSDASTESNFWLMKGERKRERIWRPNVGQIQRASDSPPIVTSRPSGARTRRRGGEGAVAAYVEDHVVVAPVVGESMNAVVDHVVCPQAPNEIDLLRAAHAGDLGSELLGDLDRIGTDATGCADD